MSAPSRRTFLIGAAGLAMGLAGCATTQKTSWVEPLAPGLEPASAAPVSPVTGEPLVEPGQQFDYAAIYARQDAGLFPVPAVDLKKVNHAFLRAEVNYDTDQEPGTIVIDPHAHYLYHVEGGGRAMRYGVGVGREGFGWSGEAVIKTKQEWPDWYPPKEMIARQPELAVKMSKLQSGIGMHGGPGNPLGARAMYLWQGNKDTLFRIHGTVEPWTIGKSVSSGCIRMINQDVMDLYLRTPEGTKVVVLGSEQPVG
ncbi:L,D-transpeptidase [Labrys wisconsinensis]|uniref:Lipoprotein-anchoring transpeptidase ErfK/SrfK n=1 Tax=Labrys wisconsinensis TaxID=425677 RepID=A0ABU0JGY8_9HYPH|nr:L,D-transpeptidase [Labrys wisconsinensis]MDQ0473559.1 lipoprotein-anchoring transpeptidase ErfK/SrfK [Labrys wisconsinensis]